MTKKNKKKQEAAALKFNPDQDLTPTVVAKGKGALAERIVAKAKEADIPIQEDKDLVTVLLQLELGEEIPEELYQAVAQILSFIYDLEDLV